jgi:hypothetical protein
MCEEDKKLLVQCHLSEYSSIKQEMLTCIKLLYSIVPTFLMLYAGILAYIFTKAIGFVNFAQFVNSPEVMLGLQGLILTTSLYLITSSGIGNSMLRTSLYIKGYLIPNINKLLGKSTIDHLPVLQWEYVVRGENCLANNFHGILRYSIKNLDYLRLALPFIASFLLTPLAIVGSIYALLVSGDYIFLHICVLLIYMFSVAYLAVVLIASKKSEKTYKGI